MTDHYLIRVTGSDLLPVTLVLLYLTALFSALLWHFSTAGTFNMAQEPSEEPSVTPSVLHGLQLQAPTGYFIGEWECRTVLSDNLNLFFFLNFVKHHLWSSKSERMWWICDFPAGSASFPLKWIWICRLSCSWTPWFLHSLCWKHLVTWRPSQSPSNSVRCRCQSWTPKHSSCVWLLRGKLSPDDGVLHMTPLFFLETAIWSKLRIYFKFWQLKKIQSQKLKFNKPYLNII